jgi:hypothetical protein
LLMRLPWCMDHSGVVRVKPITSSKAGGLIGNRQRRF